MKVWAFGGNAREDDSRAGKAGKPAGRGLVAPPATPPGAIALPPRPPPENAERTEPQVPPRADPILALVRYLARRWGRPESPDVILAGLPLDDGLLTVKLLPRALDRVGLLAK